MIKLASILTLSAAITGAAADCCTELQAITDRVIPWSPGVLGGITNYVDNPTNDVTAYGAVAGGVVECHAAFTNALARCPVGYSVYVPEGTYLVSTNFKIPSGKVLRGASATNTVINLAEPGTVAIFFGNNFSKTETPVTGATGGQSNFVVSSATSWSAGKYAVILQTNDPAVVFGSLTDAVTPWQGQMFKVTNVSGTTITVDRPIYDTNYGTSRVTIGGVFSSVTEYAGIENCKLSVIGGANNAVAFYAAANCWLKNVCITNSEFQQVATWWCYRIEIRDSRFENHSAYDSTSRYSISLNRQASDCLVENNICLGNNLGIAVQQGACGNVIAYNLFENGFGTSFPSNSQTKGGMNSHGDNANRNLYEGNVAPWMQFDNFWGENNHEVAFRNWLTRQSYYNTTQGISDQGQYGLFVDSTNRYMTSMGNIIGRPRDAGLGNDVQLAYDRRNSKQDEDPVLTNTFIQHLDFMWGSGVTTNYPAMSTTLCPSLYLTNRPSWFGRLAWPPIGPDVNTTSSITNFPVNPIIPALAVFYGIDYASPPRASSSMSGKLFIGGKTLLK